MKLITHADMNAIIIKTRFITVFSTFPCILLPSSNQLVAYSDIRPFQINLIHTHMEGILSHLRFIGEVSLFMGFRVVNTGVNTGEGCSNEIRQPEKAKYESEGFASLCVLLCFLCGCLGK